MRFGTLYIWGILCFPAWLRDYKFLGADRVMHMMHLLHLMHITKQVQN